MPKSPGFDSNSTELGGTAYGPELRRRGQVSQKFEVILRYGVNLMPAYMRYASIKKNK